MATQQILASYRNGNTYVELFSDGTKKRYIPEFEAASFDFPESMDVKITDWCDAGCAYCHEKSTTSGKHGNLLRLVDLFKDLPAGVEIAIGGGHPLAHPDVAWFLERLNSQGLICNLTINELHFDKELDRLKCFVSNNLVKGIGYSYRTKPCTWEYEHLVNHVIIGSVPYSEFDRVTEVNKKTLLLGYKTYGKGERYFELQQQSVLDNIASWYRGLPYAAAKAPISFDNLAIEQLNPRRMFETEEAYNRFYLGKDGSHSCYIDSVKEEYAISSTNPDRKSLADVCSTRAMFKTLQL